MRNLPILLALLLTTPALLAMPSSMAKAQATATDAEARSLFSAGQLAFESGRFDRALEHFTRAYELSGRSQLLFNIAVTHDRLRHDREALAMFEQYLAAVPDAINREEVEGRIVILREAVSRAQPALAITPTDAAAATTSSEPVSAAITARDADEAHVPVTRKWWFWTVLGVAVAGVATGVAIAVHDPGTEGPLLGNGGIVVRARGAR